MAICGNRTKNRAYYRRRRPAVRRRMSARAVLAAAVLGLAALLPLFVGEGSPALDNMVQTATFVTMALGLNVVVGFAGLLDLGYVAFFAIGAHVTATLASTFWANAGGGAGVAILVDGPAASMPGIHVNFLIVVVVAAAATTLAGVLIGVPTLRLRGTYVADRHARVRRDHRADRVQRPRDPAVRRVADGGAERHHRRSTASTSPSSRRSARWTSGPGTGSPSRSSP